MFRLSTLLSGPFEQWPIDSWLFAQAVLALGLLALAGVMLYRTAAALTLRYSIDRNGLYIQWLGSRAIIPLTLIDRIEQGALAIGDWRAALASIGYFHGRVQTLDGVVIHRFTTRPLAEALVIYAGNEAYAISPTDQTGFVQELEQRRRLGAIQQLTPGIEVARFFVYDFWADPVIRQLLLVTLVLNLLLFGAIAAIYPTLPLQIEWRGDQIGAAAELAPRIRIFFLPVAAALTALFNLIGGLIVYRRSPLAARLWQGFSLGVQLFFAIATIAVLRA
ncbi:PH domain-containing protein [Chloroflexus sp.]|uniref:PH domain-containing protein n=1 Tax=Chloroflexus sp. TaxID=1904827 RepID=UPI00298F21AA|nr:PH domain-containing protein [Chloroflexus sp.]MDW8404663.1 PH domain-containing protein [Chloroflexus sp.]